MTESKKTFLYVDAIEDFDIFQKLTKNTDYFKNNLHLFTCAVLVGKFVLNETSKIENKRKDVVRIIDNRNDENLAILKCLAISEYKDVNILTDEKKMFEYCEKYARTGLHQIYEWHHDPSYDLGTVLSRELIGAMRNINLDDLK